MIKLDQRYARQDFIDFLQDTFLQDYVRDVRPVGTDGHAIHKATSLGRSETLDLQVFEFEYSGSASKRVALTKEAFQIMKQSATFNALAVFYGQDNDDWRLSFLTANPERTEKGRAIVAYSNPRRYSFFLGPNAKINTPNRFLIKDGQIKSYDDLLSRFNVEIVTKEFFENYKKLFDRLLAYLNKDHAFQSFAGRNGVETANFAKKLLGQIVFLYFLQRKGWLGAKKGDSISAGDKNFLRSLFNKSVEKKTNFYNEYLEKLFYGALNKSPEKAGSYYRSYFDCQIPFLNGGLFEPPQDYDWEGEFLLLPDKLFSKNPNDPTHGDGILDIFDLYNFTVDESDFLDKEVSVDPEMLGKVFENLLEENLRKGKGTYYTPREIVNYMCEESVVNYLTTETGLASEDIKNKYFPAYNVLGDEKFEVRDVSVSEQIIESLKNIKIVDPACGSGAFLVGMLQQITHLRYDLEGRSKLLGRRDTASSEYEIKKQTIQNCIYGVDIDPGAVDIAKLRLWLSLVVDYDLEEIEPLPNLDYKIMQGNSLLEELVLGDTTVKLYDQQTIEKALGSKKMKTLFEQESQVSLFDGENDKVLKTMRALQLKYFSTSDSENKKKIRDQIDRIEHDLIDVSIRAEVEQLSAQRLNIRTTPGIGLLPEDAKRLISISSKESQIMAVLDELKKTGTKPFFLWHLHFADVFEEKGGFDTVIANPPYIRVQSIDKTVKKAYTDKYYSATNNYDIYVLFDELALSILRQKGFLAFIQPNKFFSADYGIGIRKSMGDNSYLVKSVDFGAGQVFNTATTYTCLLFCKKLRNEVFEYVSFKNNGIADLFLDYVNGIKNNKVSVIKLTRDYLDPDGWFFGTEEEIKLYSKIEKDSITLKQLTKSTFQGIVTSADPIYILEEIESKFHSPYLEQFVEIEREIIKPLLKGSDIKRYSSEVNKYWLVFPYDISKNDSVHLINAQDFSTKYPKAWEYLMKCEKKLRNRENGKMNHNEWFAYVYPKNLNQFEQPKIMIQVLAKKAAMTLDSDNGYYFVGGGNAGGYGLTLKDNLSLTYLLALLNSSLLDFYLQHHSSKFQNDYFSYAKRFIERIPIKIASDGIQSKLKSRASEILRLKQESGINDSNHERINKLEEEINRIVYELYGLTEEDIKIVEGKEN